ncbi:MAG: hypothetical protein R3Y63_08595 [Eubacteriales bacterium]
MNYFITYEERDKSDPYIEFMVGEYEHFAYDQPTSLYLSAYFLADENDVLETLEIYLGLDYYGCVKITPANWANFLEALDSMEDSHEKEILTDLCQDLELPVLEAFEEKNYFHIVGM